MNALARYAALALLLLPAGLACVTRSTMEHRPLDAGTEVKLGHAELGTARKAARDALQRAGCSIVGDTNVDEKTIMLLGKTHLRICTTIMPSMGVWSRVVIRTAPEGTTGRVLSEKFDPRDAFAVTSFVQANVEKYLKDDVEESALDAPAAAPTPAPVPAK